MTTLFFPFLGVFGEFLLNCDPEYGKHVEECGYVKACIEFCRIVFLLHDSGVMAYAWLRPGRRQTIVRTVLFGH